MYEITVQAHFSAAHFLNAYEGKCAEVHGHNFEIIVTVEGEELQPNGLLIDFKDLKAIVERRTDVFDHRIINEVPPFDRLNPTVENFTRWLFETLWEDLKDTRVRVKRVTLKETDKYCAAYAR